MYRERFKDFHDLASGCRMKNLDESTIRLAKKHLLPNQTETNKTTVVIKHHLGKEITTERTIRFDDQKKEFYIFYKCSKYWVQPVKRPLNKHDMALYKWKVF